MAEIIRFPKSPAAAVRKIARKVPDWMKFGKHIAEAAKRREERKLSPWERAIKDWRKLLDRQA
jgi:hypothetical protein